MCKDKAKSRCNTIFADCVKYEGNIPEDSELSQDDCNSIQDVVQDLYKIASQIQEDQNLSEVDAECFENLQDKRVKNYIQVIMDKMCEQEDRLLELETLVQAQQQEIEDLQNNNCPE